MTVENPCEILHFSRVYFLSVVALTILGYRSIYALAKLGNEKSRETVSLPTVSPPICQPIWYLQVHLISLLQIQDGAQASSAPTSISCSNDRHAILYQVCCIPFVPIVEIRIELVGPVQRSDEFSVIGVVGIVNVATADVSDDPVELDDFSGRKCFSIRKPNCEVNIW